MHTNEQVDDNAVLKARRFSLGRVPCDKQLNMRKTSRVEPMIELENTRLNNV